MQPQKVKAKGMLQSKGDSGDRFQNIYIVQQRYNGLLTNYLDTVDCKLTAISITPTSEENRRSVKMYHELKMK